MSKGRVRVRLARWRRRVGDRVEVVWGVEARHQGKWRAVMNPDDPAVPLVHSDLRKALASRIYYKSRLEGLSIEESTRRSTNEILVNQHYEFYKREEEWNLRLARARARRNHQTKNPGPRRSSPPVEGQRGDSLRFFQGWNNGSSLPEKE